MTSLPVRGRILEEASHATLKTRHDVYGDPFADMDLAASMKALYDNAAYGKYHQAHEEAMSRVFIKIARIASGAFHEDNYVDAAAYMAIAAECQVAANVAQQNVKAAKVTPEEVKALMRAAADAEYKAQGLVVEDPINADTKLPEAPERKTVQLDPLPAHIEKKKMIMPMIDPGSPAKAYSNGKKAFKLGSLISFGASEVEDEPLYMVINIQNGGLGEFTAQHESSGGRYHGIAAHIYKVVTY